MIKRKGVSKGDIVQSIQNLDIACQNMYRHILLLDDVIAKYIDMKGDSEKLQKFINKKEKEDGKHKQPKRKRSRTSTKTSK